MELEQAEKFLTKEVMYHNLTGILNHVSAISIGADKKMILGYTDTGIVINIVLYKVKNEKGEWIDIDNVSTSLPVKN